MGRDRGVTGKQARRLLGQELAELAHCGVRLLCQVQPAQAPLGVDHEQRRRVVDLASLDLHGNPVGLPNVPELGHRAGEEVPLAQQAMDLGVAQNVVD